MCDCSTYNKSWWNFFNCKKICPVCSPGFFKCEVAGCKKQNVSELIKNTNEWEYFRYCEDHTCKYCKHDCNPFPKNPLLGRCKFCTLRCNYSERDCENEPAPGSEFCEIHKCKEENCGFEKEKNSTRCYVHL